MVIVALIGLGWGMPSILTMIWGAPVFKVYFDALTEKHLTGLYFQIYNPPLDGFLVYLGTRRQLAIGVSGYMTIEERYSARVVFRGPIFFEDTNPLSPGVLRIDIPPSAPPDIGTCCEVMRFNHSGSSAQVHSEPEKELDCGAYRLYLQLECGGKSFNFERGFYLKMDEATKGLVGGWDNME